MGYRSDVRIATTREGYDLMCEHVDFASKGTGCYPLMGSKREPDFFDEEGGCVAFGWDGIKWDVGYYKDVTNVDAALRKLAEAGIPYEFCRVGEEYGDVEFSACGDNEMLSLHVEPVTCIDIV